MRACLLLAIVAVSSAWARQSYENDPYVGGFDGADELATAEEEERFQEDRGKFYMEVARQTFLRLLRERNPDADVPESMLQPIVDVQAGKDYSDYLDVIAYADSMTEEFDDEHEDAVSTSSTSRCQSCVSAVTFSLDNTVFRTWACRIDIVKTILSTIAKKAGVWGWVASIAIEVACGVCKNLNSCSWSNVARATCRKARAC